MAGGSKFKTGVKHEAPADVFSAQEADFKRLHDALRAASDKLLSIPGSNETFNLLNNLLNIRDARAWRELISAEHGGALFIPSTDKEVIRTLREALKGIPGVSIDSIPPNPTDFSPAQYYNLQFHFDAAAMNRMDKFCSDNQNPLNPQTSPLSLSSSRRTIALNVPVPAPERPAPKSSFAASSTDTPAARRIPKVSLNTASSATLANSTPTVSSATRSAKTDEAALQPVFAQMRRTLERHLLTGTGAESIADLTRRPNAAWPLAQFAREKLIQSLDALQQNLATATLHAPNGMLAYMSLEPGDPYSTLRGLQAQSIQYGITSAGIPFMLVDEATRRKLQSLSNDANGAVFTCPYIVPFMPEDGVVLARGQLDKNGRLSYTSAISESIASADLDAAFLGKRREFSSLIIQSDFENSPLIRSASTLGGRSVSFATDCGRMDAKTAFSEAGLYSSVLLGGAQLLTAGVGPMDANSTSVEEVAFFSLITHTTEKHRWIFGRQGDTYWVADADSDVRGKGKTQEDAILKMTGSGWCEPGTYYRFDKKAGQKISANSPLPVREYLAMPVGSWQRSMHDFVEASSPLLLAGMVPLPAVRYAALPIIAAQLADQWANSAEMELYKGPGFSMNSGEGYALAANLLYGASFIPGWGRLALVLGPSRAAAGAFMGTEMAAFGVLQALSQVKTEARMAEVEGGSGSPLASRQTTSSDWGNVEAMILAKIYCWCTERYEQNALFNPQTRRVNETLQSQVHDEIDSRWLPQIHADIDARMPPGLSAPEQQEFRRETLGRHADWIFNHHEMVDQLADWISGGFFESVPDAQRQHQYWLQIREAVVLQILSSGGPLMEGTAERTSQLLRQKGRPADYENAAHHLLENGMQETLGLPAGSLSPGALKQNLITAVLNGKIPISRVLGWSAQYDPPLMPTTDSAGARW